MSQKEVDRLEIIQRLISRQISQIETAEQLNLSTRQIRNLRRQYERLGVAGLISKRRGCPSNNRLHDELRSQVVELIKTNYHDFKPTFAHEKLTEQHGLKLSVESTRQIMMTAGIWTGKKRKAIRVHQHRARRSCLGELIQIDGSPHDWFEDRGPRCCLLVFIDDATSQLMYLHFADAESTEAYFTAAEAYIKLHGRPLCYYSDRHSIFRVNIPEATTGTGETQFGRAMRELGIKTICANSPQAKGRVERANGVLQDRLIKEMRLRNISSITDANEFLPAFMADYNKRFAVAPADAANAHRASIPDAATCSLIFSKQYQRHISNNLEVSYKNLIYQIQSSTPGYTMRRAKLTVYDRLGEITLCYKGKSLPYKIFDKKNKPATIVSSKQINRLEGLAQTKPRTDHPWRRNYSKHPTIQFQILPRTA